MEFITYSRFECLNLERVGWVKIETRVVVPCVEDYAGWRLVEMLLALVSSFR